MVDEERLFLMTRMASFEENEGKKTIPICEFFRSDYVGFHMLLSAVYITVAYVLVTAVYLSVEFLQDGFYLFRKGVAAKVCHSAGSVCTDRFSCVFLPLYHGEEEHKDLSEGSEKAQQYV